MNPKTPNHFQVLGVLRSASDEEIRRAYRQLVLKHHPDRNSSEASKQIFNQVQQAYEVLRDPERRLNYQKLLDLDGKPPVPKAKPAPKKPQATPSQPTKTASYKFSEEQLREERAQKTEAARKNPVATEDLLKLTGFLARARFAEAEKLARKLVRNSPNHALPYAALGDIARMRGDLREAAEMYSLATQMDPNNPSYLAKFEEVMRIQELPKAQRTIQERDPAGAAGVVGGSLAAGFASVYVAISNELPLEGTPIIINTWTIGLMVMLAVAGIAVGAGMCLSNHLERFQTGMQSAVMTIPPGVALGMMAALNFWFAAAVYLFVGASQNAFNKSTSRLVGVVALMTLCFTGASALHGKIDPTQTLFWGGNVLYIGCLCGWVMADSFKEVR